MDPECSGYILMYGYTITDRRGIIREEFECILCLARWQDRQQDEQ